jgi:hypothetical protein
MFSPPALVWNSSTFPRWFHMEYRGKSFTVVQGVEPGSWKWTVRLNENIIKSGESPTRAAAVASAHWAIDQSLAAKKPAVPPKT